MNVSFFFQTIQAMTDEQSTSLKRSADTHKDSDQAVPLKKHSNTNDLAATDCDDSEQHQANDKLPSALVFKAPEQDLPVVIVNPRREEWDASWEQRITNAPFKVLCDVFVCIHANFPVFYSSWLPVAILYFFWREK